MSSKYNQGYDHGYIEGYDDAVFDHQREVPATLPAVWQEVTVDPKGAGHTYRLRVPGGWLYRTVSYRYPELHHAMESGAFESGGNWFTSNHQRAMEISNQTTVFVPE